MKNISVETQLMNILSPKGVGGMQGANRNAEIGDGPSFADTLKNSLSEVNNYQNEASKAIEEFVTGDNKNITDTLSAVNKAEMSFKLTMQVRNKLLEAYKEVMRTSV